MLVAQSLYTAIFLQCSRLTANLASVQGFLHGSTDATTNGIILAQTPTVESHLKAQAAKFRFHLHDLELMPGHQWFQVLA